MLVRTRIIIHAPRPSPLPVRFVLISGNADVRTFRARARLYALQYLIGTFRFIRVVVYCAYESPDRGSAFREKKKINKKSRLHVGKHRVIYSRHALRNNYNRSSSDNKTVLLKNARVPTKARCRRRVGIMKTFNCRFSLSVLYRGGDGRR